MPKLCIIISAGRSGSKFLLSLLAQSREILPVYELFSSFDAERLLSRDEIDGSSFWQEINRGTIESRLAMQYRIDVPEYLGDGLGVNGIDDALLGTVFPYLFQHPKNEFDRVARKCQGSEATKIQEHFDIFFGHINESKRHVIMESSGGSIRYLGRLLKVFPEAKIIFLYRRGVEVALSMSRHPMFSIAMANRSAHSPQRRAASDNTYQRIPGNKSNLGRALSEQAQSGRDWNEYLGIPIEEYGRMWSWMMLSGLPYLSSADYMWVRYEELVRDEHRVVSDVLAFLQVSGEKRWMPKARVANSDPLQVNRDVRLKLERACRLGEKAAQSYER